MSTDTQLDSRTPPVRAKRRPPRLLYVVTEDWYFLSHRLPMARAARAAGFEVHVATRVVEGAEAVNAEGFALQPVSFVRGRISPLDTIATIRALRQVHRRVAPDIAHHVSLQASVLGSIAALGRPVASINALTGFGYAFTSDTPKTQLLRPVLGTLLRGLFNRSRQTALVQNPDDHAGLAAIGIDAARIALIPGSGVDVEDRKSTRLNSS